VKTFLSLRKCANRTNVLFAARLFVYIYIIFPSRAVNTKFVVGLVVLSVTGVSICACSLRELYAK